MGSGYREPDQPEAGLSDEPRQMGPIVRNTADGKKQLVHARWGLPSPIFVQKKAAEARAEKLRAKGQAVDMDELIRMEPDRGVTMSANSTCPTGRAGSVSSIDALFP